ncbi:late histone H2B.L4-like [Cervus canadensis]|uniref:late histone H2B.L4-like n=1 Tax=Cervus canadensis TaxID=1574408 RepID=UPI001CA32508|nr:late histone H2B.L4-like [Cervus canadensis]
MSHRLSCLRKTCTPSKLSPLKQNQGRQSRRLNGRHDCSRCSHHCCCRSSHIESFASYFTTVLKQVHMGLSLSQEAVNNTNSFMMDIFKRIAKEAGCLARNKSRTITSREIQTSVHLLLSGEISKHTMSEATRLVIKYATSR